MGKINFEIWDLTQLSYDVAVWNVGCQNRMNDVQKSLLLDGYSFHLQIRLTGSFLENAPLFLVQSDVFFWKFKYFVKLFKVKADKKLKNCNFENF